MEHLKPGIVHRLANADLYCSALANIYGDPNFHNLSHWNIIQALARKGVYVAEPTDVALTETVLIQVSPIKMVGIQVSQYYPCYCNASLVECIVCCYFCCFNYLL